MEEYCRIYILNQPNNQTLKKKNQNVYYNIVIFRGGRS